MRTSTRSKHPRCSHACKLQLVHVGVDIGGTFTDIVRLPDGTLRVSKVSSTPEDPGLAAVTGSPHCSALPAPSRAQ